MPSLRRQGARALFSCNFLVNCDCIVITISCFNVLWPFKDKRNENIYMFTPGVLSAAWTVYAMFTYDGDNSLCGYIGWFANHLVYLVMFIFHILYKAIQDILVVIGMAGKVWQ